MNTASPRIAFVSGYLPLGGSTTFLCNVAGELVRRGVAVRVLCTERHHPLASDFEGQEIPVFIPANPRLIYEDRLAACVQDLRAFAPTLVVGCLAPPSFELLRYVPPSVQRVGMVQSDDPIVYKTLGTYGDYLDGVVGVSKTIAARLRSMEIFAGKQIAYIPYGVPMPSSIQHTKSHNGPLRILYLGRLDEDQKRVRLFPKIHKQLCDSGIPFRWTLAGDGPERAYLQANMPERRPDQRTVFLGQIDYANVPTLLGDNDVLLLTSSFEGLPLSLLEAMGQGVVPVVTDLESGIREVVNGTNGLLVPVDDIDGYAQALIRLHNNRVELAKKRTLARSSVFPTYSISAMADQWLQLVALSPVSSTAWPDNPPIHPPLGRETDPSFSKAGRCVRRMGAWFRKK